MVDALDSKSGVSNGVRVRVSSPVKSANEITQMHFFYFSANQNDSKICKSLHKEYFIDIHFLLRYVTNNS